MEKYTLLIESDSGEKREYFFYAEELVSISGTKDEIRIIKGNVYIIKRIGKTLQDEYYILEEPETYQVEVIGVGNNNLVTLFEGYNEVALKDIDSNYLFAYYVNFSFEDITATPEELITKLEIMADSINLKVGKNEVISAITQSSEETQIDSNKVKLEGITTINDGFSVDLQGNMQCRDATINGGLLNQSGIYTSMSFSNNSRSYYYVAKSYGPLGYIGYNYDKKRIPVLIKYLIPENFIVLKAYLIVRHQSVKWQFSANENTSAADIEVYIKEDTETNSSFTFDFEENYGGVSFENYIGTRINNIWSSGVNSYTFPTGYKVKKTTNITSSISALKNGIIAFAPKATTITFDPNNPLSPERDFSSFLGATLYIYGYLEKEE